MSDVGAESPADRKRRQAKERMRRFRARQRRGERLAQIPADVADELPDDEDAFAAAVAQLLRRQLFTA